MSLRCTGDIITAATDIIIGATTTGQVFILRYPGFISIQDAIATGIVMAANATLIGIGVVTTTRMLDQGE